MVSAYLIEYTRLPEDNLAVRYSRLLSLSPNSIRSRHTSHHSIAPACSCISNIRNSIAHASLPLLEELPLGNSSSLQIPYVARAQKCQGKLRPCPSFAFPRQAPANLSVSWPIRASSSRALCNTSRTLHMCSAYWATHRLPTTSESPSRTQLTGAHRWCSSAGYDVASPQARKVMTWDKKHAKSIAFRGFCKYQNGYRGGPDISGRVGSKMRELS